MTTETTETRTESALNRAYETARDAGKEALEEFLIGVNAIKTNRASLKAESAILRKQARDAQGMARWSLNAHRTGRLRTEARAAHLAWGYLRGIPYEAMEGETPATITDMQHFVVWFVAEGSENGGRGYYRAKLESRRVAAKCKLAGFEVTAEDIAEWVAGDDLDA